MGTRSFAEDVVTLPELARELAGRLSRRSLYRAAASGSLPTWRVGRRLLASRAAVEALLRGEGPRVRADQDRESVEAT